jgi:uncharacterized DUF497 family protein
MAYEFDPKKNRKNKKDPSRGFDFDIMERFEWSSALTSRDTRKDYGEIRNVSFGLIEERVHVVVWTQREQKRIISLRKANTKERTFYEEESAKKETR